MEPPDRRGPDRKEPDRKAPEKENGRLPVPASASVPAAPIGTGPVPEGARPVEETIVEVDGLLITLLPGGELALVDSHPDGATSVINLGTRRMEALAPLLRADGSVEGGGSSRTGGASDRTAGASDHDAAPPADLPPEEGRERAPPERGAAPAAGGEGGEPAVDWDLYDEQLKAAFLLEQYARGVPPEDLPPGWEAVLAALPAALTRRSRRTRTSPEATDPPPEPPTPPPASRRSP